jgi:hypothetical protein
MLARFVAMPSVVHWDAAVGVLRFLKGTKEKGILLGGQKEQHNIVGYADSDWGSDPDDRISVSGGIVFLGASVLTWFSRKQVMVSLSTAEAESHALVDTAKDIIYVQRLAEELGGFVGCGQMGIPVICSDNQPAIDAIINGTGRTKHYDLRIKFLAQGIAREMFAVLKVSTEDNLADIFTKVLRKTRFGMLASVLVCDSESQSKSDGANFGRKI